MSAIPERAPERTAARTPERAPARRARLAALVATGATLTLGLGALPALAAAPAHPAGAAASAPKTALATAGAWTTPTADETFHRLATYPVFQNRPAGEDAAAETVAEISAVSEDGRTVVHTDALARRIGFLDITDPTAPPAGCAGAAASAGSAPRPRMSAALVATGATLILGLGAHGGAHRGPLTGLLRDGWHVSPSTRVEQRLVARGGATTTVPGPAGDGWMNSARRQVRASGDPPVAPSDRFRGGVPDTSAP